MKLSWFAMLLVLPGCYSYVRSPAAPVSGREFSLNLSDAGSAQMASTLGPGVLTVRGRVIAVDDQRVEVAATSVVRRDKEERWSREILVIPRNLISSVDERKMSPMRSAAFAGAIIAGSFIIRQTLAEVLGEPHQSGSSPKPPPGT